MLNQLRQTGPLIALLICVALLATWVTGVHAHRHVGGQSHQMKAHGWDATSADFEHEHGHEPNASHELPSQHSDVATHPGAHLDSHSMSLIHQDGHENIELQALQPPSGKVLPDLMWLALICVAVLVLNLGRTVLVAALTHPPDGRRTPWSLRPPLRGPPLFSVV